MSPTDAPVIALFRAGMQREFGDRIERMVLYGSRARGDAREDSDYDIAVFLKEMETFGKEIERIVNVQTDVLTETGAVVHALPFEGRRYEDRTLFMGEVRREGVDI